MRHRLSVLLASAAIASSFLAGPASAASKTADVDVADLMYRAANSGLVTISSDPQAPCCSRSIAFEFSDADAVTYTYAFSPDDGLAITIQPANGELPIKMGDVNVDQIVDSGNDGLMRDYHGEGTSDVVDIAGVEYKPFFQDRWDEAIAALQEHIANAPPPKKITTVRLTSH